MARLLLPVGKRNFHANHAPQEYLFHRRFHG
jgi:hypothetical protein